MAYFSGLTIFQQFWPLSGKVASFCRIWRIFLSYLKKSLFLALPWGKYRDFWENIHFYLTNFNFFCWEKFNFLQFCSSLKIAVFGTFQHLMGKNLYNMDLYNIAWQCWINDFKVDNNRFFLPFFGAEIKWRLIDFLCSFWSPYINYAALLCLAWPWSSAQVIFHMINSSANPV